MRSRLFFWLFLLAAGNALTGFALQFYHEHDLASSLGIAKQFTGIDSRYEAPDHPEICLDTTRLTAEESADAVIDYLRRGAMI